ncbi:MAG TPA: Hsp20/alpha crystallin family protein [Burkholderiales bacterium]|jgi:HSP20 family molecular chaperone IbpA
MATATSVAKKETGAVEQQQQQPKAREDQSVLRPPVDIYEDAHGITVLAEMPGVAKDRLKVHADRNTLTIEGEALIDMPAEMEAIYADVQATRYARSFVLSGELETDAIDAKMKDGVLTIRIPKRSEFRPRKIEVKAG